MHNTGKEDENEKWLENTKNAVYALEPESNGNLLIEAIYRCEENLVILTGKQIYESRGHFHALGRHNKISDSI